jgi:hypothetical protein
MLVRTFNKNIKTGHSIFSRVPFVDNNILIASTGTYCVILMLLPTVS